VCEGKPLRCKRATDGGQGIYCDGTRPYVESKASRATDDGSMRQRRRFFTAGVNPGRVRDVGY